MRETKMPALRVSGEAGRETPDLPAKVSQNAPPRKSTRAELEASGWRLHYELRRDARRLELRDARRAGGWRIRRGLRLVQEAKP